MVNPMEARKGVIMSRSRRELVRAKKIPPRGEMKNRTMAPITPVVLRMD